jgi:hypothetical protein
MTTASAKRIALSRTLPLALAALLVLLGPSPSQAEPQPVTKANYKLAFKYSPEALRPFVYSTSVRPNWIGKSDSFWYEFRTSKGTQYYRVNPAEGRKEPLFDRTRLATQLSELTKKAQDPLQLPLARLSINDEGTKIKFVAEEYQYEYDLKAEKLSKLGKAPPSRFGPPARATGRGGGVSSRNANATRASRRPAAGSYASPLSTANKSCSSRTTTSSSPRPARKRRPSSSPTTSARTTPSAASGLAGAASAGRAWDRLAGPPIPRRFTPCAATRAA